MGLLSQVLSALHCLRNVMRITASSPFYLTRRQHIFGDQTFCNFGCDVIHYIVKSRFLVTNQSLVWFHSYLSQTPPLPFTHGVPQGSGLGPLKFVAYTSDIPNIFSSHNVQYHFYANDTEVYNHCTISEVTVLVPRLTSCFSDLPDAFASLQLQQLHLV